MNNAEASGSDDDDDDKIDEVAAVLLEAEGLDASTMQVDASVQREQDIMAEVARRRMESDASATKRKSDEIFTHFDSDGDGYLNYTELCALGKATGGDLPQAAYGAICKEIGANPARGVTKELLLVMYTDAGMGDAHRDHNFVFKAQ
mmetsp:Transcript_38165/g.76479  ORF Transcript_38165/g.76479 Transcript_38165/m.76479 type:complete len:147 (-) Transcript_38165:57-497(-)